MQIKNTLIQYQGIFYLFFQIVEFELGNRFEEHILCFYKLFHIKSVFCMFIFIHEFKGSLFRKLRLVQINLLNINQHICHYLDARVVYFDNSWTNSKVFSLLDSCLILISRIQNTWLYRCYHRRVIIQDCYLTWLCHHRHRSDSIMRKVFSRKWKYFYFHSFLVISLSWILSLHPKRKKLHLQPLSLGLKGKDSG